MELKPEFLERCVKLSSQLGLLHGSYDFAEGPDRSFTFLEINEMGQFLWLEERLPELPCCLYSLRSQSIPAPIFDLARGVAQRIRSHAFLQSEAYPAFRRDLAAAATAPPFHYLE